MSYNKYYPNGWANNESGGTPITAGALNHMESGIKTAVDNMDNTGSNAVTYTSEDKADSAVLRTTGWTTVSALVSGMTHSNLFNAMSKMFKNIRWLYKMLGTTDISNLSTDGTVTGALSKLNTDISIVKSSDREYFTPAVGQSYAGYDNCFFVRKGNLCWLHIGVRDVPTSGRQTLLSSVPTKYRPLVSVKAIGTGGSGYDVYCWAAIDSSTVGVHTSDGYAQIDCLYIAATNI